MNTTSRTLCFLLVLVLLLNPSLEQDCTEISGGWILLCTDMICGVNCYLLALGQKGKPKTFWKRGNDMDARSRTLCLVLVHVLLLNPSLAEQVCTEINGGWIILCTDLTCRFDCYLFALKQTGKLNNFWCNGWHKCRCLFCTDY
ncbi:hypothetical protein GUJ93_ZPchr0012g18900 [Zizania palustris]|uniref:Uncharacterized protein n=1 Tax=Zizania palustris TaxID=103762 RepID=A0A8J5WMB4_ZIZPA|nr:hypothetical protein GUJ93_ZPchr0308g33402 [Zizania palustris]KAG8091507.1 hypothetical protein GUJ93_ZPchr0012g18900 [Zizania palustris]